ncbi:hypothetical protein C0Q70_08272 [Pomacea canaliculata]|uniref:Uncharacterized protein n=1 Tax=Pomacea canaliculata TaxID=400727 RepID=A0A2T7PHC8_POMCA|nr:hypothetical protein C0Q70_08272 [Pomacea canaliculata]
MRGAATRGGEHQHTDIPRTGASDRQTPPSHHKLLLMSFSSQSSAACNLQRTGDGSLASGHEGWCKPGTVLPSSRSGVATVNCCPGGIHGVHRQYGRVPRKAHFFSPPPPTPFRGFLSRVCACARQSESWARAPVAASSLGCRPALTQRLILTSRDRHEPGAGSLLTRAVCPTADWMPDEAACLNEGRAGGRARGSLSLT